jgi:dipeptidase E
MTIILASEFSDSFTKTKEHMGAPAGKHVLMIDTAARGEGFAPPDETNVRPVTDLGAKVEKYDLKDRTEQQARQRLNETDILYVCGGNTFYLLYHLQKTNFAQALKQRLAEGLLYIGSSAGSVVAGKDIGFIAPMDDPHIVELDDTSGLQLFDGLFLPHFGHEMMGKAALEIIKTHKGPDHLYVLDDNQALIVDNKGISLI